MRCMLTPSQRYIGIDWLCFPHKNAHQRNIISKQKSTKWSSHLTHCGPWHTCILFCVSKIQRSVARFCSQGYWFICVAYILHRAIVCVCQTRLSIKRNVKSVARLLFCSIPTSAAHSMHWSMPWTISMHPLQMLNP